MTTRDSDVAVAHASDTGEREYVPTGRGHESRDVRIRPIAAAFIGLLVAAGVIHVLVYGVLALLSARQMEKSAPASPLEAQYGREAPPEPRLQIAPRDDLARLHEREDAMLHAYGWVDRERGVVRIPIDRAKELVAARGVGGAPKVAATEAGR